jgi:hypothetical protein
MSVKKKARGDALSTDPPWLGLAVPAARQTQASLPRYRGALQPPGERRPTRGAQDPSTRYGLTAGRTPPKRVARPSSRKLGPPTKQPFGGGPFTNDPPAPVGCGAPPPLYYIHNNHPQNQPVCVPWASSTPSKLTESNTVQWISWLPHRWRTQQSAIGSVNCRIPWIIEFLNAHCAQAFGLEHVCLSVVSNGLPSVTLAAPFEGGHGFKPWPPARPSIRGRRAAAATPALLIVSMLHTVA